MSGRHAAAPSRRAEHHDRHRERRTRRWGAPWGRAGTALLAAAVLVAAVVGWSATSSDCDEAGTLTLAAAPEIADVVDAVVAETDPADLGAGDGCRPVRVEPADPHEVAAAVGSGAGAPDLWVPDTSAWLARLPAPTQERQTWPLAKTPVVLAGPDDAARPDTWLAALSGPDATLLDPRASGAGVGALAALHAEAVHGASSGTELSTWLVDKAQDAPDESLSDADLLAIATNGGAASTWFPTTEQRVIDMADQVSRSHLRAVVPRSGTVLLDYPLVPVATGSDADRAVRVAEVLADRLLSRAGQRRLAAAGFRPPSAMPSDADGGVGAVDEVGVVQPNAVAHLLRTWEMLTADARMLAVLDVSGSMREHAGQQTRIALARGAVLTALRDLPSESQMGLWAFSVGLGAGDDDHWVLAPVRRLGPAGGGISHRATLAGAVRQLPRLVGGGTALYDTVLAAYRAAVSGYAPNRFNGVVVLTDGRNEDPDGLRLRQLLDALKRLSDPARPVPVITVGLGPQADVATLERIAEATGGASHVARDPRDIGRVFTDALLDRVGWGMR